MGYILSFSALLYSTEKKNQEALSGFSMGELPPSHLEVLTPTVLLLLSQSKVQQFSVNCGIIYVTFTPET